MVPQLIQGKALNPNLAFEVLHSPIPMTRSSLALFMPRGLASGMQLFRPDLHSLPPGTEGSGHLSHLLSPAFSTLRHVLLPGWLQQTFQLFPDQLNLPSLFSTWQPEWPLLSFRPLTSLPYKFPIALAIKSCVSSVPRF